jgi:general secretion pathway protein K
MRLASRARGLALLLVMWALFIMSFAIIGLLALLKVDIGNASGMERVAQASALAFSGVTIGRNTEFPMDGTREKQAFREGGSFEVTAISENGKLNVNRLLEAGERDTLRSLFRIWGLSDVEADTVLDCLLDYVEPGASRRMNGAKAPQYRAIGRPAPPGRLFRSIDEMASVLNFDLVSNRKENWREYFTIYGDGTLDLTAAAPEVIRAVCRVGDSSARAIQQGRSELKDMDAVRTRMGLTSKEFEGLQGRLSLGGKIRRVRSVGTFAQATRTIEAIYQISGGASVILEWREW